MHWIASDTNPKQAMFSLCEQMVHRASHTLVAEVAKIPVL